MSSWYPLTRTVVRALGTAIVGFTVTEMATVALLLTDDAGNANVHNRGSTVQKALDWTGIAVLVVGWLLTVAATWRAVARARVRVGPSGVRVSDGHRPVTIGWPMIAAVSSSTVRVWRRQRRVPALLLVTGQMVPLRGARVSADAWETVDAAAFARAVAVPVVAALNDGLHSWGQPRPQVQPSSRPLPRLRSRTLPDGDHAELRRTHLAPRLALGLAAPMLAVGLTQTVTSVEQANHQHASVAVLVAFGSLSAAAVAAAVTVVWARLARRTEVGHCWVGCNNRLSRWHKVLFADDVVATAFLRPGRYSSVLVLRRADGRSLSFNSWELQRGFADVLLAMLGPHPALDADIWSLLLTQQQPLPPPDSPRPRPDPVA